MIRRLTLLGIVVALLGVHTVVTDRDTRSARAEGGRVLDLPGGDLRYRDEGDRDDPTVVLIHGFAASLRWWDRVAPELARRGRRVIRFDLLGHGGSEMPRDGYGVPDQAQRIERALEQLGVRRATIVGHSLGGHVAIALAEANPRLVRRVVVIGTPPRDGFAHLPLTGRIATWPVVGELARRFTPDQVIRVGLQSAFADGVEVPDRFVDDLDGMTYTAYDDSSGAGGDFLDERSNPDRIEAAGMPLMVIFGTKDEIVDPDAADAWREDDPRAKVVKIRGAGHSPHWERAGQVSELIRDFSG